MTTPILDINDLQRLRNGEINLGENFVDAETILSKEEGAKGTNELEEFNAKAMAWF